MIGGLLHLGCLKDGLTKVAKKYLSDPVTSISLQKSKRYKSRRDKWQIQENPVAGDVKELQERSRCNPILRSMILTDHISSFFGISYHLM